jgi:hypothetical protein
MLMTCFVVAHSTDYVLIQDKKFKEWVYKYAKSEELFFNE